MKMSWLAFQSIANGWIYKSTKYGIQITITCMMYSIFHVPDHLNVCVYY